MIKKSTWMKIAGIMALESKAVRAKVGAVAVIGDRIVATGINGTPSGRSNICETHDGNTKPEVTHAEINIIAFAAKHGISLAGSDLYCSLSPCVPCAAALSNAGVVAVYYRDAYRDSAGLQLLSDCGIKTEQISDVD